MLTEFDLNYILICAASSVNTSCFLKLFSTIDSFTPLPFVFDETLFLGSE